MTCQHTLFGSGEGQFPLPQETLARVSFQPIVDTFEHRILAYECSVPANGCEDTSCEGTSIEAARLRSLTIQAAAREAQHGLYFLNLVPSSIEDPGLDMMSSIEAVFDCGMKPGNVILEVVESDLMRDPAHSHRIREYLGRHGFGFAVGSAGIGAGVSSFQAVSEFAPDYIALDKRLTQNIDERSCAPAISKLVQMAEKSGARVIAEGVDRARLVESLWLLGVQFMQGHLFGDPSPHIA